MTAATVNGCAHPERCGSDGETCCRADCVFAPNRQPAVMRRERVIREYQRRARAAVRVLAKHGLEHEYLAVYEELKP